MNFCEKRSEKNLKSVEWMAAVWKWHRYRSFDEREEGKKSLLKNIVNETKMWFWPQSNVTPQDCYYGSRRDDNKTTISAQYVHCETTIQGKRKTAKWEKRTASKTNCAHGDWLHDNHGKPINIIKSFCDRNHCRWLFASFRLCHSCGSNVESVVFCLPFPNGDECACIPIKSTGWRLERRKQRTNAVVVSCLKIAKKHFICLTSCIYVWVCTIKVVRYLPTDKSINFPAHWRNVCACVHCALNSNNKKNDRSLPLLLALFANCTLKDIRNEMRSEDKMSICRQNCKHYLPRFHSIWTIFMVKCIR